MNPTVSSGAYPELVFQLLQRLAPRFGKPQQREQGGGQVHGGKGEECWGDADPVGHDREQDADGGGEGPEQEGGQADAKAADAQRKHLSQHKPGQRGDGTLNKK